MKLGPNREIWVYVERHSGEIEDISLEVLRKSHEIALELGDKSSAIVIGDSNSEVARQLSENGANKIYFVDSPELHDFDAEATVEALMQLFEVNKPGMILFGASLYGNDIACRMAPRLSAPLITNCTDISFHEDGSPLYTKSTHGNRASSTFAAPSSHAPQMATLLSSVLNKRRPTPCKNSEVVSFHPEFSRKDTRVRRKALFKAAPDKVGLDEADIIVSGGRGMGSRENFELIGELSAILGGVSGASLGAVNDGFALRSNLIGQTGMTVSPRLYLACGISGSIYHVLGMKDAKAIVAINRDRNADIFKYSDMGIVGDAAEILESIKRRLEYLSDKKG